MYKGVHKVCSYKENLWSKGSYGVQKSTGVMDGLFLNLDKL